MGAGGTPSMPLEMLAALLAGAEIGVMMWWVQNEMPYTPQVMSRLCDRFAAPGVRAILGVEREAE